MKPLYTEVFEAKNIQSHSRNTGLSAVFLDINDNELKKGDKVIMTLKGLGSGEMDIVEHENELCLYDATQGYYPLKFVVKRDDIILERRNTVLSNVFSVGKKVYFTNEKLPYKVMAVSERYAVVSRPLNRREDAELLHNQVKTGAYFTFTEAFEHNKQSPIYSIIDFEQNIKATDNMIFGIYDYAKESDCKKAIKDLESGELELSFRNRCELSVDMERSVK